MDHGERITARKISKVDRRLNRIYRTAQKELEEKLADFNKRFREKDRKKRQQLQGGEITQQDYKDWLAGQVFIKGQWQSKVDEVCAVIKDHNNQSAKIIREGQLDVFAENYNVTAMGAELKTGINFNIYNTDAVARLLKSDPQILPQWNVDERKDYVWNKKKVSNAVTQGIIQGESIEKITKRLCKQLSTQNENRMRLFARTSMTGAQNAGRQEHMRQAAKMGIQQNKRWIATLDSRTRDVHRHLDQQEVPYNESFESDLGAIRFPGDMSAEPANVYNCRCRIVTIYPEYEDYSKKDWREDEIIDGQTYAEWKEGKVKKLLQDTTVVNPEGYNWADYVSKLTPQARKAIEKIAYKAKGSMSITQYWDEFTSGKINNEAIEDIISKGTNFKAEEQLKGAVVEKSKPQKNEEKENVGMIKTTNSINNGKTVTPTEEYKRVIKSRYENAPEYIRKIYDKYVPMGGAVDIGDYDKNPICKTYKDGRVRILMNFSNDEKGLSIPGATWYHEHGHYIDSRMGTKSKSKKFLNAIREDVLETQKKFENENDFKPREIGVWSKSKLMIEMTKNVRTHGLQDIFTGVDYEYTMYAVFGHDQREYWDKYGRDLVADEAFAHMFESMFDEETGELFKKYMPKSYSIFTKWMKEEAKNEL